MKLPRRTFLHLAAGAAALPAISRIARAQTYPTRPITIVDTFPPGGSTGIVARIIADRLSEKLRWQVVVEQRPGAGGTVGARQVSRSTSDGYTLMLGFTGTLGIAPSFYPDSGYDPRKDFTPIGRIGAAPSSLVTHPSAPYRSVPELITYAKARPGELSFGSAGIGTLNHAAGELFAKMGGIRLLHVPYRGTAPALNDLLGNHVPLVFAPLPTTYENVKGGMLRMLGVTSANRSSLAPEVPTIAEQGLPGYEAVLRYGLVGPAGLPAPIVERLNKELQETVASDDVRSRFAVLGVEPSASTPKEYAADIDIEEVKWSTLVKALGLKAAD
jgi:tripartite-type tricarboxylate transporter receptor subunit TctC